jgi:hypothetical protein
VVVDARSVERVAAGMEEVAGARVVSVVALTDVRVVAVVDVVAVGRHAFGLHKHFPTVPFAGQSKQFVSASSCSSHASSVDGKRGGAPVMLFLVTKRDLSAVRAPRFTGSAVNEQFFAISLTRDVGIAGMLPPRSMLFDTSK